MAKITLEFDDVPCEQDTTPEVFIIECLGQNDWSKGYRDGFDLYNQLLVAGRRPRYVQALSENDLKAALVMFRQSKCRLLHFSFHGNKETVCLGSTVCDYQDFARITQGFLNSRRVFISACECGNANLFKCLYETNKSMHSVLAHSDAVSFSKAIAFWLPFYHTIYGRVSKKINNQVISYGKITESNLNDISGRLAVLAQVNLSGAYFDAKNKKVVIKELKYKSNQFNWKRCEAYSINQDVAQESRGLSST